MYLRKSLSKCLFGSDIGLADLTVDQIRILRLAICLSTCFICAIALAWPLAYLSPMLLCSLIGSPKKPLALKSGIGLLMLIFLAFFPFVLMGFIIPRWPGVSALLLIIGFYYIFYLKAVGKLPELAAVLFLVGITIMPLMALTQPELSLSFTLGFLFSAFIAVVSAWLSFLVFPDPKGCSYNEAVKPKNNLQKHEAQVKALTSTIAITPLALIFYSNNLIEASLVFAFVAILMQNPDIGTNLKAGAGLLLGNLLGGIISYMIFVFLKSTPTLPFFAFLMLLSLLLLGQRIFSEHKFSGLYSASLSTVILLLGSVTGSAGGDFEEKFLSRMVQLFCASTYVVLSLIVLKGLLRKKALKYLARFEATS
ncbi:DUF2955 domain-containing protein [Agaribacterium sp. ZY112]|uniref:DUF2955 domain-containing protein n=1 Tax=Agaribacterium sp. ZY112 TaxID=3233574 RepID=UPI0035259CDF